MSPPNRRPRPAFLATPTPFSPRHRHRYLSQFRPPVLCSTTPPPPPPPPSSSSSSDPAPTPSTTTTATTPPSDRVRAVHSRLESTRTRVRLLNSRVIVRVAQADIRLAESLLSTPPTATTATTSQPSRPTSTVDALPVDSNAAVIARLRRDLRALRRLCEEHPSDQPAATLVAQMDQVVNALSKKLARPRSVEQQQQVAQPSPHEEAEELIESADQLVDDSQWHALAATDEQNPPGVVESVKRKVVERSDALKRKASSVGAGIEEKVGEFVKDDGSIDVDGLRALVGSLLDNAGMTWKRLNGEPTTISEVRDEVSGEAYEALVVQDHDKEFRLREQVGELEKRLIESSKEREAVLRREDQLGKLIRAKEIRLMDDGVSALRRTLAVRVLQLEMEKIFASVADEIENSDTQMMMEQRVLVAEFGDLDERLATLELYIEQEEPLLVDDDILGELAADIQDLKTRLGLDAPLYSSATLSWPQVQQFFASTGKKTREGVEFYSRGMRLFAGDLRFAMRLIRRAVLGYTPSPREIRTIRRTGRDLLTLIPFTIVLVAPLTPVGHVLIFGFLQRYWPEFFPSTFSERRQAVMKRHEQYAKTLGEDVKEVQNDADGMDGGGPGKKGRGSGGGGRLAALRKLLFFGVMAGETSEEGGTADNGARNDASSSSGRETGSGNPPSGRTNGAVKDEVTDKNDDEHPVALSDLAEKARDTDMVARKKRITMALEELHLAD